MNDRKYDSEFIWNSESTDCVPIANMPMQSIPGRAGKFLPNDGHPGKNSFRQQK